MDMMWKIGEFALVLIMSAAMIYYVAIGKESVDDTQEYVTNQNYSDAYAERYASLSSFDADAVGKISVQEALNLVFTYASDATPVIVKGPNGPDDIHVYVTDTGGWVYSTHGKPLGYKIDASGNYYQGTYNTGIRAFEKPTEPVPDYQTLYNYLSNNQRTDVFYLCNINPDNKGNLKTILLVATN